MSVERRSISLRKRAEIVLAQSGRCALCRCKLQPSRFEIDHIAALCHDGGNDGDNLRALCVPCHRAKTRTDVQSAAKVKRLAFGRPKKSAPMPGSRASGWKRRMDGTVERR